MISAVFSIHVILFKIPENYLFIPKKFGFYKYIDKDEVMVPCLFNLLILTNDWLSGNTETYNISCVEIVGYIS